LIFLNLTCVLSDWYLSAISPYIYSLIDDNKQTNKQTNNQITKRYGLCPRTNYTDRATATCRSEYQLLRTEGCRVVSAVDPVRPLSRFSRPEPLRFLSSSSSVVLTRQIGTRSRPITSQRMW
jgi:hypothetical protein